MDMDKSQEITQALKTEKGFKNYFKGGFGKKARIAFDLWSQAKAKGVFAVTQVADFSTTGVGKTIYAFSIDGQPIPESVFGELKERAVRLTDDDIKKEDRNWLIGFEPLAPPAGHPANEKGNAPLSILRLSDGLGAIRTFLNSSVFFDANDAKSSLAEYVIYLENNDGEFIRVLEARHI
jgi:hypothetical protein